MSELPEIQRPPVRGFTETGYDAHRDGLNKSNWHELSCGHGTDNGYVASPSFSGAGPWHWCDVCRRHRRSLRWLERHPNGARPSGWAGRG